MVPRGGRRFPVRGSKLPGVGDVLDPVGAVPTGGDRHGIESIGERRLPETRDPVPGDGRDLAPFERRDGGERVTEGRAPATLDLHERDDTAPPRDEVDFPVAGPVVARDDDPAGRLEEAGRSGLAGPAEIVTPGHA